MPVRSCKSTVLFSVYSTNFGLKRDLPRVPSTVPCSVCFCFGVIVMMCCNSCAVRWAAEKQKSPDFAWIGTSVPHAIGQRRRSPAFGPPQLDASGQARRMSQLRNLKPPLTG